MTAWPHPELLPVLIRTGRDLLDRPAAEIAFTRDQEADALVNDLERFPHAFLMGCLLDRQIIADRVWRIPFEIRGRLGSFDFERLRRLSEDDWLRLLSAPTNLHRFAPTMASVLHRGFDRVATHYGGNAANLWSGTPASATLVRRFLEFHGVGPKIATMAANILVREFHVPLRDYRYIDISADVHVRRVMGRLGFADERASPEIVVYAAREAYPDFPGIFDVTLFELGRTICRPTKPRCRDCPYVAYCRYAAARNSS